MIYILTMIVTNIYDAKAKLSELLEAVANGERVLICKRNRPVAELRAVESVRTSPRPTDPAIPGWAVPASFFEPLPADVIDGFEGQDEPRSGTSKVAEKKTSYRQAPPRPKR
jgi:prevent-host-death family protein